MTMRPTWRLTSIAGWQINLSPYFLIHYRPGSARWMRHHRTATASLAVSLLLLVVASVVGSTLWNEARVRRLRVEAENLEKDMQLEAKARARKIELEASATAAESLARVEISRNQFASALSILQNALQTIETELPLREQSDRISRQVARLKKLVEFYRLSDYVHEQNVLSRDTKALIACAKAIKTLGVEDRADWWAALPSEDLSPQQVDALRWDVYQQLMLMDAMMVKQIGVRLAAGESMSNAWAFLRMAGRVSTTERGKT